MQADDPVIWRAQLQAKLGKSSETIRRWIKENRLPPPDVDLTRQSKGWKTSTLRAKGINV